MPKIAAAVVLVAALSARAKAVELAKPGPLGREAAASPAAWSRSFSAYLKSPEADPPRLRMLINSRPPGKGVAIAAVNRKIDALAKAAKGAHTAELDRIMEALRVFGAGYGRLMADSPEVRSGRERLLLAFAERNAKALVQDAKTAAEDSDDAPAHLNNAYGSDLLPMGRETASFRAGLKQARALLSSLRLKKARETVRRGTAFWTFLDPSESMEDAPKEAAALKLNTSIPLDATFASKNRSVSFAASADDSAKKLKVAIVRMNGAKSGILRSYEVTPASAGRLARLLRFYKDSVAREGKAAAKKNNILAGIIEGLEAAKAKAKQKNGFVSVGLLATLSGAIIAIGGVHAAFITGMHGSPDAQQAAKFGAFICLQCLIPFLAGKLYEKLSYLEAAVSAFAWLIFSSPASMFAVGILCSAQEGVSFRDDMVAAITVGFLFGAFGALLGSGDKKLNKSLAKENEEAAIR